jgi:AcrR family transcriptional regulator
MVPREATARALPGRPRRYGPDEELRLLFDAAIEVMRRNEYGEVTVAEILAEAGVSTRSFYRHFASKDDLLIALIRRETDGAVAALEARVARAKNPRAALEIWVDEMLSLTHDRAKARKVDVLVSPAAMRANGSTAEVKRATEVLRQPLVMILTAGRMDGTFTTVEPFDDADAISKLVWDVARQGFARTDTRTLAEARAFVLSFSLRAIGGAP